jgi:hypothetical protein
MSVPNALTYVPEKFVDRNGTPFTLDPSTVPKYLSAKYLDLEIETMKQLGVHILTELEFLQDLASSINRYNKEFVSKPLDWHSRLAKVVLPLLVKSGLRGIVRTMRIIPLRNGRWAKPSGNLIFFSAGARRVANNG